MRDDSGGTGPSLQELAHRDLAYTYQLLRKVTLRDIRQLTAEDPWEASRLDPTDGQRGLLDYHGPTVVFAGGYRGAKSLGACLKILQRAYRWPKVPIMICRWEYATMYASTMKSLAETLSLLFAPEGVIWNNLDSPEIPKDVAKYRAGVRQLELAGGATIQFQHLKEVQRLGSTEYGTIWIEEASEVPNGYNREDLGDLIPEVITMLEGRLNRSGHSKKWGDLIPQMEITSNYEGHNWVWQMAVGSKDEETLLVTSNAFDLRGKMIHGRLAVPDAWFKRAERWPESRRRRHLHGSWEQPEGAVFTGFTDANVVDDFSIPKDWPCIRGLDPGITGGAWVWLSVAKDVKAHRKRGANMPDAVKDGTIVTWDEYEPSEVKIEKQVEHVVDVDLLGGVDVLFTGIDPTDARQQTGQGLKTTAELLGDLGIMAIRKAPSGEAAEKAFVLRADQGFLNGEYVVLRRCKKLIQQIRDEIWDEASAERGEKKRKYSRKFHTLAAWKYAILMEPELQTAELPKPPPVKYPTQSKTGY